MLGISADIQLEREQEWSSLKIFVVIMPFLYQVNTCIEAKTKRTNMNAMSNNLKSLQV